MADANGQTGRGKHRAWVAAALAAALGGGALVAPAAQATTAPTNSITVHVKLTDSGVKLIPPKGMPVAEAGFVTLFRVYNKSSSSRRFIAASQSVALKQGANSGFYVYFPKIAHLTHLQWESKALGGGKVKSFDGRFAIQPCKTIVCREQG